jgi:hypothetical protein
MGVRKAAFSAVLLGTSIYILLPTPDELFIYPTVGFLLNYAIHLPFIYGVLLAMIAYRGAGVASLLGALLMGGKPIYNRFKALIRKKSLTASQAVRFKFC